MQIIIVMFKKKYYSIFFTCKTVKTVKYIYWLIILKSCRILVILVRLDPLSSYDSWIALLTFFIFFNLLTTPLFWHLLFYNFAIYMQFLFTELNEQNISHGSIPILKTILFSSFKSFKSNHEFNIFLSCWLLYFQNKFFLGVFNSLETVDTYIINFFIFFLLINVFSGFLYYFA